MPSIPPVAPGSSTGLPSKLAAPLAYSGWWVTGLLFLALERRDTYVRFHAAQAVTAFGLMAMAIALFGVLAGATIGALPTAFSLFMWAAGLTWAAGVLLWVVSVWKTARGEQWRMPVAAELADRLIGARRGRLRAAPEPPPI